MLTEDHVGCAIEKRPYVVGTCDQFDEFLSEQGRLDQGAEAEGSQTY